MYRKKNNAEREARCSGRAVLPARPYKTSVEKCHGLSRDSEGFIVPIEDERQQNDIRGKGPYFAYTDVGKGREQDAVSFVPATNE